MSAFTEPLAQAARGLRAAREFINGLPLNDGASKRAIDREYVAVKLIPEALAALDRVERLATDMEAALRYYAPPPTWDGGQYAADVLSASGTPEGVAREEGADTR